MIKVVTSAALLSLVFISGAMAQGKAAKPNPAKQKACSAEAYDTVRRTSGRNAGNNVAASRAQWKGYFDQCMMRS